MNSDALPIWFIFSFAEQLLADAVDKTESDPELATAWVDQATGIIRMVDKYHRNSGWLSLEETERFNELDERSSAISDDIPPREKWPQS